MSADADRKFEAEMFESKWLAERAAHERTKAAYQHNLRNEIEERGRIEQEMATLAARAPLLEAVATAARKRLAVWTRETYGDLVDALAALDGAK